MNRVVLFDIDGTILHAGRAPAKSILRAIEEVYGVENPMPPKGTYSFAGKTDPEIVADLLVRKGFSEDEILERLEEVFARYINYLRSSITEKDDGFLHPGILPLLRELDSRENVILGLLTGNIEEGARIKLGRFSIADYFKVGAFGSDSPDRNELPAIVLERVNELTGRFFEGENLVIIGDSIHDIRCARTVGAMTVAVATGTTSRMELSSERPDHLLDDLSQTKETLDIITN